MSLRLSIKFDRKVCCRSCPCASSTQLSCWKCHVSPATGPSPLEWMEFYLSHPPWVLVFLKVPYLRHPFNHLLKTSLHQPSTHLTVSPMMKSFTVLFPNQVLAKPLTTSLMIVPLLVNHLLLVKDESLLGALTTTRFNPSENFTFPPLSNIYLTLSS